MSVIRYDPWGLMTRLNADMERLFPRPLAGRWTDLEREYADWVPAVDIQEKQDRFVIRADLPGVEAKDLEITMEEGVLSLQGKRETNVEEDGDGFHRVERTRGRFHRRFSLPDTVDSESISADYEKGVLVISVPKHPEAEPRRVQVRVN